MNTLLDISTNLSRRTQLKNDSNYIHIMKYMGSKRELLPEIKEAVDDLCKKNGTILDIFAGTASVGAYLKDSYNIISNDIQEYSKVLGDAVIGISAIEYLPDLNTSLKKIKHYFDINRDHLQNILKNTLSESDDYLLIGKNNWTESDRKKYQKFISSFPSPVNAFHTKNDELKKLYELYLENNKASSSLLPAFQTCFLFPELYFSLRQAIDIDSIVYGIKNTFTDQRLINLFTAALIYAYSYCSSGTGHFAMFRDLKSVKSVEDVFLYRGRIVWDYFESKLMELYKFHKFYPNKKYIMTNKDYVDVMQSDNDNSPIDLIYADPPYSFVHYSRFYHAIESLVKYDYNIPQFKGRYRDDRHQSPFCQRQNVESAFELLFHFSRIKKSNILLSYSDTGMISIEKLKQIAQRNSYCIEIVEIKYNHSTMGREGHKSNLISEYLIKARL